MSGTPLNILAVPPKTPGQKSSKKAPSSAQFTLNEREIQAAYRTPGKTRKREYSSSLSTKKTANSSSTLSSELKQGFIKKFRPTLLSDEKNNAKVVPTTLTLAYITEVFSATPLPQSEISTWNSDDDKFLMESLHTYHLTGPFGKCDWVKVYKSFDGRYRETALKSRWAQLRDAHDRKHADM